MTTPSESAPAVAAKPAVKLDDFGQMAKERLLSVINEAVGLSGQVKAASGDPQSLLENLRENSDNEQAQKITAAIEKIDNDREALVNKRDEILKPIVTQMIEAAKSGSEGVVEKFNALKATAAAGRKYLVDLYGDAAVEDLPKFPGMRSASGGSNAGSGQRRVRGFDAYVDGVLSTARNGKGEQTSNLAAAAKQIGVDTEQMRELFFGAAGSKDSKDWPATVEFTVTAGENTHTITCKRVKEDETRATESASA